MEGKKLGEGKVDVIDVPQSHKETVMEQDIAERNKQKDQNKD